MARPTTAEIEARNETRNAEIQQAVDKAVDQAVAKALAEIRQSASAATGKVVYEHKQYDPVDMSDPSKVYLKIEREQSVKSPGVDAKLDALDKGYKLIGQDYFWDYYAISREEYEKRIAENEKRSIAMYQAATASRDAAVGGSSIFGQGVTSTSSFGATEPITVEAQHSPGN